MCSSKKAGTNVSPGLPVLKEYHVIEYLIAFKKWALLLLKLLKELHISFLKKHSSAGNGA
jgi:hypothetical protein